MSTKSNELVRPYEDTPSEEYKQILDDIKNSTQAVDEAVRNIRWDDDEDEDEDEDEQAIRNKK